MTLFLISFAAGVLTVLSPCVLPLLPVIVGGSLAGGTSFKRALTVTISLGVSVFLFTFLLKVSTAFISVPQSFWSWLSGGILIIVGLLFLFPKLWDLVPGIAKAYQNSNSLMSKGFMQHSAWGDIIVGAALGPVFSTCSPTYFVILATVLPVSLAAGTADIFGYILGLCLFLLLISFVGQRALDKLNIAADGNGWLKRTIGVLFIGVGILVGTGTLAAIEAPLYNIFDETKIEQGFLEQNMPTSGNTTSPDQSATSTTSTTATSSVSSENTAPLLTAAQKQKLYPLAPELVSPDAYLDTNGQPISLAQYRGKNVVLVDFWTYSCINCQRTLPYLTAWYSKYKDQGLVIIGVHTPEFAFEHVESNVAAALKQFGITYPVVLDNEYKTWNAYNNEYWPHEYVIDIDGYVVHDHIGEGSYDETEKAIQTALAERMERLNMAGTVASSTVSIAPQDLSNIESPETYFGSGRNQYLGNGNQGTQGTQNLTLPTTMFANQLYLGGSWNFVPEYASNTTANATIEYEYNSKNIYFVASGMPNGTEVQVLQDGAPVGSDIAGSDVVNGILTVTGSRLYNLVSNKTPGLHTIELIVKTPGLQAYTFTFG